MLSLKKYYSQESGVFDANRNLFKFQIPRQGLFDLSQSYVVLPTEIDTDADGVYNVSLSQRANCLIKNARIECQKLGIIEDVNNVNVLNATMDKYIHTKNEEQSYAWNQGTKEIGSNDNFYSCFQELNIDDTASKNLRPELYIKVSELFKGVGQLKNYPASALGRTTITLELENDSTKTLVQQNNRYTGATDREEVPCDGETDLKEIKTTDDYTVDELKAQGYDIGSNIMVHVNGTSAPHQIFSVVQDGTKCKITTISDIIGNTQGANLVMWRLSRKALEFQGTADLKELKSVQDFLSAHDVGFWVSQQVHLQDLQGVTNNKITKVEMDGSKAKLTFENDINGNAADVYYGLFPKATATKTYKIYEPLLKVVEIQPTSTQMDRLQKALKNGVDKPYRTWVVERFNIQAGSQFNKQMYLDAGCDKVLFLASNDLDSSLANFSDYRTQMNGVDTTNKNVPFNTSLYKDRVMSKFPQNVKNLTHHQFVVPESVYVSNERQAYQVQLNSDGNNFVDTQGYLFKRVQKVLRI